MNKTILIVDDDPFILKTIALKFQKSDYEVSVAKNAEEAEEVLASSVPNVVLLDIILPGVNGLEILKKIKSNPKTKEVPVVIFSNLGSNQEIKEAMDLGATKYIVKANLTPDLVVEEINKLLSK